MTVMERERFVIPQRVRKADKSRERAAPLATLISLSRSRRAREAIANVAAIRANEERTKIVRGQRNHDDPDGVGLYTATSDYTPEEAYNARVSR